MQVGREVGPGQWQLGGEDESLEGKMSSLEEKMLTGREYDKVIQEAEQVSTLAVISTLLIILLLTGIHQDPGGRAG